MACVFCSDGVLEFAMVYYWRMLLCLEKNGEARKHKGEDRTMVVYKKAYIIIVGSKGTQLAPFHTSLPDCVAALHTYYLR